MCPTLAGSKVGAGCGQKPHRAQVSSLGQKGQEERRATGKGEGWRKDGELRPRASEKRLVRQPGAPRTPHRALSDRPELPEPPDWALSDGRGAGHGPPRLSEVAGILTQEVSAQAGVVSLVALLTPLGPCHRCLRGGRGGGLQWIWGQAGGAEKPKGEEPTCRAILGGRRAYQAAPGLGI